MKNKKGFTLVEILAVVVILGILMIVGIGAYSRYKEKARIQAYDTMAKSASLGMEEFRLKHARISSIDFDTLYENNLISSITDPSSKRKCEGKVSAVSVRASGEEIASDSYIVNLCCSNYNYTYKFPEGTKTADAECKTTEVVDTDSPVISNLTVASTNPNYNDKIVTVKFDVTDDSTSPENIKMCISTTLDCEDYVDYSHDSEFDTLKDLDGSKTSINVFVKDETGNIDFETKEYKLFKECIDIDYTEFEDDNGGVCDAECKKTQVAYSKDKLTGNYCGDTQTRVAECESCVINQTYIISYNANGGTGAPSAQTKEYGEDLILSTEKPTKEGASLSGWALPSDPTTPIYAPGGIYSDNASVELIAVWGPKKTPTGPIVIKPDSPYYEEEGQKGYWIINLSDSQIAKAEPTVRKKGTNCITKAGSTQSQYHASYCFKDPLSNKVQVTIVDADGEDVTSQMTSWTSSNTGVATISATGLVTRVNAGVTTITATYSPELRITVPVYVYNAAFRESAWNTYTKSNPIGSSTASHGISGPTKNDNQKKIHLLVLDGLKGGKCKQTDGKTICSCAQVKYFSYGTTINNQYNVTNYYIKMLTYNDKRDAKYWFMFNLKMRYRTEKSGSCTSGLVYVNHWEPTFSNFTKTNI